jgi:RNA polymerase sigma-70 factor (ECF subfamily)
MNVEAAVEAAHRTEWARVFSVVVRLTRDIDLAQDAAQDAFASALEIWQRDGTPDNPGAWLTTTARNRAIDQLRRRQALARRLPLLIVEHECDSSPALEQSVITDDRLRLVFTCCHPALSLEARVALTLRLVCGLVTSDIARLFLVSESTMAARITRAKRKIASAGIAYRVPDSDDLPQRLTGVLAVIFLLYTEGHTAAESDTLSRPGLTQRSLELANTLINLMPAESEALGLAALLNLTEARGGARLDAQGQMVLLEHQDRSTWNQDLIERGLDLVQRSLRSRRGRSPGPYAIQAAIAAVHAEAASYDETDWSQIAALYGALFFVNPSPVVAVGRAVALGMATTPKAGLDALETMAFDPHLKNHALVPAVRADLLRRCGRYADAADAYRDALRLTSNGVVQAFLNRRITEMRQALNHCHPTITPPGPDAPGPPGSRR